MGWSIISGPVLKVVFGFLSLTFELFLYCYVFNHIETEVSKQKINDKLVLFEKYLIEMLTIFIDRNVR